jgi:Secretion system C-terminal sorting domain
MEAGEDFWIRYNSGSGYTTIATLISGTTFNNNAFYTVTVSVPNFVPTPTGTFRIQCDASDNSDQVFIDQVTITRLNGTGLTESTISVEEVYKPLPVPEVFAGTSKPDAGAELMIYPNPGRDLLNISFEAPIQNMRLVTMHGVEISIPSTAAEDKQIDIHHLAPGFYFLMIQSNGEWIPARFSKM